MTNPSSATKKKSEYELSCRNCGEIGCSGRCWGAPPPAGHTDPDRAALEAVRREHLTSETNIKTIGFLLYLGAFFTLIGGLGTLRVDPIEALMMLGIGATVGYAGFLIRRFRPGGRLIYTIFAALVLVYWLLVFGSYYNLGFFFGQFIWPMIMLWILWNRKGSTVMSAHYREVVLPGTPHVKYQTPKWLLALGLLLFAFIVLGVVAAIADL